jgi:preprotein translocase subunit SecE
MLGRKEQAPQTTPEPRPRPRTVAPGTETDNSRMGRSRNYVDSVIAELRKVNWPTREETRNLTIVVIGITTVIAGMLGVFDFLLSIIYGWLNNL